MQLDVVRGGDAGGALSFDGSDDFATLFPGFQLMSDWTVEAMIAPASAASGAFAEGSASDSDNSLAAHTVGSPCMFGLQTLAGRNLLTVTATERGAWEVRFGPDEQAIPPSTWSLNPQGLFSATRHHLSLVHEVRSNAQSRMRLFLNSTLRAEWIVNTLAAQATAREPALPMLVGACHAAGASEGIRRERFYKGIMDEVRWWDRALKAQDIETSWRWTGPPERWPIPAIGFAGALGVAAASLRSAALLAQHSVDELLDSVLLDARTNGRSGRLGSRDGASDAPDVVKSPFEADDVQFGSIWFEVSEGMTTSLDFFPHVHFAGSPTYLGLQITGDLSQESSAVDLLKSDGVTALAVGNLSSGLKLKVFPAVGAKHDSFSIQPCTASSSSPAMGGALDPTAFFAEDCADQPVYPVTLFVLRSSAPIAGACHAVQLLSSSGFVQLPRLPATVSVEAWIRLVPPLLDGSVIFSVQEASSPVTGAPASDAFVLLLEPSSGSAVMEVCVQGQSEPARILLPGLATTAAQHLALSFETRLAAGFAPGSTSVAAVTYAMSVIRNGVLIDYTMIENPCFQLDSPLLALPTFGQRYDPLAIDTGDSRVGSADSGGSRWSGSFAPMYLAELRIWGSIRGPADVESSRFLRLVGNETGLLAYAPVTTEDALAVSATAAAMAGVGGTLSPVQAIVLSSPAAELAVGIALVCARGAARCPDFSVGSGFAVRESPFAVPPEETELSTMGREELPITLLGYDPDNFDDHRLEHGTTDTLRFELVEFPDPKCGGLFKDGAESAIRVVNRWPPTEVVSLTELPLRFVPFMGATFAEEEAMGGECATALAYRAIDSRGRRSERLGRVMVRVRRPSGLAFESAEASSPEPDGRNGAGVVKLVLGSPAVPRVAATAEELLDILDGSWGLPGPVVRWASGGRVLWLHFASNTSALDSRGFASSAESPAVLVPGLTRFRIRKEAMLHALGEEGSAPSQSVSPTLKGGFLLATCAEGFVLDEATGDCVPCPAGSHWSPADLLGDLGHEAEARWPICLPCPAGRFASESASLECSACEPGLFLPEANGSVNDSVACLLAAPGTFAPIAGEASTEPCLGGFLAETAASTECEVCPVGADCAAEAGVEAVPLAGYVRTASGDFVGCRLPAACAGSGTCANGARDPVLGCYRCEAGFSRGPGATFDSSSCSECPSPAFALLQGAAALIATLQLAVLLARLNIEAARRPACLHPYVLKIGLGYLFMMKCLNSVEKHELEAGFGEANDVMKFVFDCAFFWGGVLPAHWVPIDCVLEHVIGSSGEVEVATRLWFTLLFWAVLPIVLSLAATVYSWLILQSARFLGRLLDPFGFGASFGLGAVAPDEAPQVVVDGTNDLQALVPSGVPPVREAWLSSNGNELTQIEEEEAAWEAMWSFPHMRYYYCNCDTGETTWTRPEGEAISNDPAPGAKATAEERRGEQVARRKQLLGRRNFGEPKAGEEVLERRVWGIWRMRPLTVPLRQRRHLFFQDMTGIFIGCAILTYPAILEQLLAFLRCDTFPNEAGGSTHRLLAEPSVECGGGLQSALSGTALVCALAWGIGLPVWCAWLCWRQRVAGALRHFGVRASIGLLCAEYEPGTFYWESILLFRRFALVVAVSLTHAAPRTIRLVLFLALGQASLFAQRTYGPFDQRCGRLLDVLEERALQSFCALAALLLLSMSEVVHPYVCVGFVLVALAMHMLLLARFSVFFFRFTRRSLADNVMEAHLQGKQPGHLARRLFDVDRRARSTGARVSFDPSTRSVVLAPGSCGKPATDEEQFFLAHGIAESFEGLLFELRLERLSVDILEFLARQAFAASAGRLHCEARTAEAFAAMSSAGSATSAAEAAAAAAAAEDDGSVPTLPSLLVVDAAAQGPDAPRGEALRLSFATGLCSGTRLFERASFEMSLPASDFQQAVQATRSKASAEEFEWSFHKFMRTRCGGPVRDYDLLPFERMLKYSMKRPGGRGFRGIMSTGSFAEESAPDRLPASVIGKTMALPGVPYSNESGDVDKKVSGASTSSPLQRLGLGPAPGTGSSTTSTITGLAFGATAGSAASTAREASQAEQWSFMNMAGSSARPSGQADETATAMGRRTPPQPPDRSQSRPPSGAPPPVPPPGAATELGAAAAGNALGSSGVRPQSSSGASQAAASPSSARAPASAQAPPMPPLPGEALEAELAVAVTTPSALLRYVEIAPWGVLGSQLEASAISAPRRAAPEPGDGDVVVDVLKLELIQDAGPRAASGASGAVYSWLGISRDAAFLGEVKEVVRSAGDAKLHVYPGDRAIIHVVGPDLRDAELEMWPQIALEVLSAAYRNVLIEFLESGRRRLRLPPISGGSLCGAYEDRFPAMTAAALRRADEALTSSQRKQLVGGGHILELCIFREQEFAGYRDAFASRDAGGGEEF